MKITNIALLMQFTTWRSQGFPAWASYPPGRKINSRKEGNAENLRKNDSKHKTMSALTTEDISTMRWGGPGGGGLNGG